MISGYDLSMQEAIEILKIVNLDIELDHNVSKLSGGEKQRLAIACALSKKTNVIIADEPTSSLDKKNKQIIASILVELSKKYGKTVIVASHDACFLNLNEHIYSIDNGKIKTEDLHNEAVPAIKTFDKRKLNNNFYKKVLFYKKNTYVQSIKKIMIVSFFIIFINAMVLSMNNTILNSYMTKLKQLVPNEISITNLDMKEDRDYIANMSDVVELKPYYEIKPDHIEETEFEDVVFHFYYPNDLIRFNKISDLKTNQVYLSYYYRNYVGKDIHFSMKDKDYTYEISGILDNNIVDIYGKTIRQVVYLPISFLDNLEQLETNKYVVVVNEAKNIEFVMDKIKNINPNLNIYNEYTNLDGLLQIQKNITFFINAGVFILTIIIIISVCMSQLLEMNNRMYEMDVFKANGLQNRHLFKLEIMRLLYLFGIGSLIIIVLGIPCLFILRQLLALSGVKFIFDYCIYVLVIDLIAIILPIAISWRSIAKLSMENILRK